MQYHSPERATWPQYLRGASFTDMTEMARVAKRPVFLGAGGKLISTVDAPATLDYGNKVQNDNIVSVNYMSNLEYELYDALRKPGISVQRAGTDVVVILVRDAIMELDVADISPDGADTLKTIAKILKKYDATFMEIAGYTDAMRNYQAADALSMDMAQRVGVFLAQHDIDTTRMFIVGRGAARPIAAQDDIGRLTNRRVEIRIVPAR
ncbi:MAG: OmpA family protein [Proteobacteria bacterium]|uniref:OmpA family protein n=1 Tax=Candidatus Enterousia avistercoris TaxID=2840788 RepID=A0A9D9DHA4_9PROT|nr:OmpA family protein [Candidatus Enterousia avistercoris]